MAIKGINLGGWFLMEGYILGGRNIPEQLFKRKFSKIYGARELSYFEKAFRETFIREDDFKRIASWGVTHVRLPFHHKLIETKPFVFSLSYLKRALMYAQGLY